MGRGVPNNGKRSYITRQKESRLTAKGVPIDGKRSPIATPQEESLSLKEESHLPPRDSVLKRSPVAVPPPSPATTHRAHLGRKVRVLSHALSPPCMSMVARHEHAR